MIVGFHGRLGSGKDTAGKRLANLVDLPSRRVSFADKLKLSAAASLGTDVDWLERLKNDADAQVSLSFWSDELGKRLWVNQITVREFMQKYGTEAHRDIFGDDFWIEQALGPVSRVINIDGDPPYFPDELVYVTDVRFDNELRGIHKRNGWVVRVLDGGEPEDTSDLHPSEKPLDDCDFIINNDVRTDYYLKLDNQLRQLAKTLDLPLKEDIRL